MRILREVFGLFYKIGASGGGTPYIIRGAWGLGADKGAAERRLTGGRKYAPKGNGKDEKEKKERAKGEKKREKEGKDGKGNDKKRKKHAKEERKRRKKREKRNGNGTKMRKEGRMTRPSLFQNVNSLVVHSSSELRSTLKSPLLSAFLLNSRPL